MKFHSAESVKALEYAAEKEKETEDFYRSLLNKVHNPGAINVLKSMVEDEVKHYSIIIRLLKETSEGEAPSVEMIQSDAAKVRLERSFTQLTLSNPEGSLEDASVRAILKKGLEIEREFQ